MAIAPLKPPKPTKRRQPYFRINGSIEDKITIYYIYVCVIRTYIVVVVVEPAERLQATSNENII